jgi:hypothetical protein
MKDMIKATEANTKKRKAFSTKVCNIHISATTYRKLPRGAFHETNERREIPFYSVCLKMYKVT